MTWLIHDVTPWRVDRIYLDGDGAPWIATQVMVSETGSIWDSPVVWHQPEAGKELALLLDSLGVGQAGEATGTGDGVRRAGVTGRARPGRPGLGRAGGGATRTRRRRSGHLCSRPRVVGARRAGRRCPAHRGLDARCARHGPGPALTAGDRKGSIPDADSTTEWLSVGR